MFIFSRYIYAPAKILHLSFNQNFNLIIYTNSVFYSVIIFKLCISDYTLIVKTGFLLSTLQIERKMALIII